VDAERITIRVDDAHSVSGLLLVPREASACYVFAHGAGAGMAHPFMAAVSTDLAAQGIATLRYQFPYMEKRSRRPDPPALCHATVRAAVSKVAELTSALPLFAGGKSFGGRMTSQAQAAAPIPNLRGLVFVGFPLHPPGKPSVERADHLFKVQVPMLFLQGARDEFADLDLLEPLVKKLGERGTLRLFEAADHSFHVPARSGRRDLEVRAGLVQAIARWIESAIERGA
jgi:uncharacterized protein